MAKVSAELGAGTQTTIQARHLTWLSDEPVAAGESSVFSPRSPFEASSIPLNRSDYRKSLPGVRCT